MNYKNIFSKIYGCLLVGYSLFFGYYWFFGNAIPSIKLVKNIPIEYSQASDYMNSLGIQRAFLMPLNYSTWTNTNFGYEGYSLFHVLNPKIGIWNKNDGAFYLESNNILKSAEFSLYNEENFAAFMEKYDIDVIIYDAYTDRYPRFRIKENHKKNIEFLTNFFKGGGKRFGDIYIFHANNFFSKDVLSAENSRIFYKKKSPVEYSIKLSNAVNDTLIFNHSDHIGWKLYGNLESYNFFQKMYFVLIGQELGEKIKSKDYKNYWVLNEKKLKELTLYFYPQAIFYVILTLVVLLGCIYYIILISLKIGKRL